MAIEEEAKKSGRKPFTMVDLMLDRCQHRYGVAPCTAALGVTGTTQCFNTRATCQDTANYSPLPHSLRLCSPCSPLPNGIGVAVPSVRSVSLTPSQIDITGGLGQRASLSLSVKDHPYHDRILDPYYRERYGGSVDQDLLANGGDLTADGSDDLLAQEAGTVRTPTIEGTFWGRLLARNPYYLGRRCLVHTGYIVDGEYDPANFYTREYLLETIAGPDASDSVAIKAKDPLKFADDKRAQAPRPSTGRLSVAIDQSETALVLAPAGIGDLEYPSTASESFYIRIGTEVMEVVTRAGDNLTVQRAQFGSQSATHDNDDAVQLCLRYAAKQVDFILEDLFTNYTETPAGYLDTAGWTAETAAYLTRTYSTLITVPTPVSDLVKELSRSALFAIWYDERFALIKIRALRLPDNDAPLLNDTQHLIAGSVQPTDKPELRISQAWVYFGQIDPTESLSSETNWRQISIFADLEQEGPNKFGVPAINQLYSRWITSRSNADEVAEAKVTLFGEQPRQITFSLDAKDATVWTGDVLRLQTRKVQDAMGEMQTLGVQIISADEEVSGHSFKYTAQAYNFASAAPDGDVISIAVDGNDINLLDLYTSLRGAPTSTTVILFVVEAGVIIGQDVAPAAMQTDVWPVGASITLENNGRIQGRGGDGAGFDGVEDVRSGSDGGTAFLAQNLITVVNAGEIWGGGGGGAAEVNSPGLSLECNPGGGGAGTLPGAGGERATLNPFDPPWVGTGQFSQDGTSTTGGIAEDLGEEAKGGDGGGPGEDGNDPENGMGGDDLAPGVAGNAVQGDSFITWTTTGDRRGPIT